MIDSNLLDIIFWFQDGRYPFVYFLNLFYSILLDQLSIHRFSDHDFLSILQFYSTNLKFFIYIKALLFIFQIRALLCNFIVY